MSSKNISYFLIDGRPNGRIKCTNSSWNGVVYRIPRTELEKCKDLEFLKQNGVYFLFGMRTNGRTAGKTKEGKTLKEIEAIETQF